MNFRRGDDYSGSGLLDFTADRRIKPDEPNFATRYHVHSLSGSSSNSGQTSLSSPKAAIRFESSAQPSRGLDPLGRTMMLVPTTVTSTSSPIATPAAAIVGSESSRAAELPIFWIEAFMVLK